DVLVVGGAGVDHIARVNHLPLPVVDSMIVPPILTVVGHTGSGVALGCHRLGRRTVFVDVIGDEPEGRLILERFAEAGLDFRAVRHPSGTRRAVNLVTPDGQRMSLYDPRHPFDMQPDASLWREPMAQSRHVHVSIMNWGRHALRDAVTAGLPTSVDLHDWDGENDYHRDFAYGADLVFVSAVAFVREAGQVIEDILAKGRASAVIVLDGSRGSRLAVRGEGILDIEPVTLAGLPAIDCNGAGDGYVAAFLHTVLSGGSYHRAALAGSVAGAYACATPGTHTDLITEPALIRLLGEPPAG
ncbi:MAG TPA: carbohydrate kinase family protein, partial [Gemmataceae bacterium]|nr:carbohydrate kinase family protein [Gemmataceae bacterium]